MKKDRWLLLGILIFTSMILIFIMTDREKPPETVTETSNQSEIDKIGNSIGIWKREGNVTTYTKCDPDYIYIPERNVCYNENPIGHMIITINQILAIIFTIALITIYEFKDWRIHLSSRILPYKNKYQDELHPIPKSPDLYKKNGYVWVRGGYDALVSGENDDIYIAREEHTARVGNNLILKGELKKISAAQLLNILNYDITFLKEITNNPILKINNKRLENIDPKTKIFLTVPLQNGENLAYTSIKGGFGFGADRFKLVVTSMYKMRQGLNGFGQKLQKANERMLDDARKMTQSTAVISDAVSKTQKAEIESNYRQPQQEQQGQQTYERKQM